MKSEKLIRYKATIAYDGTNFSGFQAQPNARTVQDEIESALTIINHNAFVRIYPAGRTDAGVHALAMVIHFDFPDTIPQIGVFRALNALVPEDIVVKKLEVIANDFHARYDAIGKTYIYRVNTGKTKDPFTRNFAVHHPYSLDIKKLEDALAVLVGTHDFTSFCSTKTDKKDKVRTLYKADIQQDLKLNEFVFTFHGDGFLYNMIRIIMGTALEIADGRREVSDMAEILAAKDRTQAGITAPAKGLFLYQVHYDTNSEMDT